MISRQAAKSLVAYSRHHPQTHLRTFVIPQVPGSIPRSAPVDGVVESLVKSKKYVVPIAFFNPYVAGTLFVVWLGQGRFHPNPHATVYNPLLDWEPGQPFSAPQSPAEGEVSVGSQPSPSSAQTESAPAVNER